MKFGAWPEPPGATGSPRLPKPCEGRRYLDIAEDMGLEEFKDLIRGAELEILGSVPMD